MKNLLISNMKNLLISLVLLGLLCACNNDDMPKQCTTVQYGTAFLIETNNTYCFTDDTQLEVVSLNNEYCPCDVNCFWSGQLTIDIKWTFADGSTKTYKHNAAASVMANEELPDGLEVRADEDTVVFEEECSDSNPSPIILSAQITVDK